MNWWDHGSGAMNTPQVYVDGHRVVDGTAVAVRFMDPESLCPDLLGLDYIGEADHLRGRVVRAFFWLMRFWPKPRGRAA